MTDQDNGGLSLTSLEAAEKPFEMDINGTPIVVAPSGWIVHPMENYMDSPNRIQSHIVITDLESFIQYVIRYKEPSTIIQFSKSSAGTVKATAVIDFHGAPITVGGLNAPMWGSHLVTFSTEATTAWKTWTRSNTRMMNQAKFADFIYQNIVDIKKPVGADMLEIIQTLKATAKGEFKDMKELKGSFEIINRMEVTTTSGAVDKELTLPESMSVSLTPFYGGPAIDLKADIMLEIPKGDNGRLALGYRFYRMDDALEIMAETIKTKLETDTLVPVYRCK
jgi:uncharacterized protein YfdQ (DUF2303 family)